MVAKYRLAAATVSRYLSKFGKQPKPVASLSPFFDIPQKSWDLIRQSPYDRSLKTETILPNLFSSSRTFQQKAVAGSLMLEYGMKLELRKEKEYVLSLLRCGLAPQAIAVWKERRIGDSIDETVYCEFLTLIYCRAHRVKDAESLVQGRNLAPPLILEFVKAYTKLKDYSSVNRWSTALISSNASPSLLESALRSMVRAKMWHAAQQTMKAMTARGFVVPSDVAAACVLAAKQTATDFSVAAVLSNDGAVLNSPLLRLAVGRDVRREVSEALRGSDFDKAYDLLENSKGHHEIALCYMILQSQRSSARKDRAAFLQRLKPLYERALRSRERSGRYVQFILSYHYTGRDFTQVWKFVAANRLTSSAPLISPLSVSNYQLLWRAVLTAVKEKHTAHMPFTIRDFLLATLSNVPLTPRLMRLVAISLFYAGDLQGLISFLEFSAEKSGIQLDAITLKTLLPDQELPIKSWREVADLLCRASSRNLGEIEIAAEPLRAKLQAY